MYEPGEIIVLTETRYFEPGMATPKVCQGPGDDCRPHQHTTTSRVDRQNTPFACSNAKKNIFANSVRKDSQLTIKAI